MNEGVIDTNLGSEMSITPEIKAYLKESAKWANFLAIVGFISIGLLVILGLFMGAIMNTAMGEMANQMGAGAGAMPTTLITILYLIMGLLYFFPTLYLFRFARKMKVALASDDQAFLSASFMNLKSMFKFMGILMAIIIGFYLVIIVFMLLGGMFAMM